MHLHMFAFIDEVPEMPHSVLTCNRGINASVTAKIVKPYDKNQR